MNELIEQLEKLKNLDSIIIVEGKKDKLALEKFGIKNIMTLSKKPLFAVIEEIAEQKKETVILTDLDKKGKQLYGKLDSGLQKFGVKVNNKFREFLFKKTKLRQIEGIVTYIKNLDN